MLYTETACMGRLSKFTLGTVQLGMNYGIVGKTEQPTEEYAHKILDTACLHGVNMLDTANNYGDSDPVIGTWLKTSPANPTMIVTKIGPFDHSSKEALQADVRRQAEEAVKTLGLATFYDMPYHLLVLWRTLNYLIVSILESALLFMLFESRTIVAKVNAIKNKKH